MMLTLESYSNPAWADSAHTEINAHVKFKEFSEAVPFTASQNDTEKHGRDIFSAIVANEATIAIAEYPVDDAKTSKSQEVRQGLASALEEGFASSALGSVYTYPSTADDQRALIGIVVATLLPGAPMTGPYPYKCIDANGVAALRDHTAAQIQQVFRDGEMAFIALQKQNESLQAQLDAAPDPAAVAAIKWQRPAPAPPPPHPQNGAQT